MGLEEEEAPELSPEWTKEGGCEHTARRWPLQAKRRGPNETYLASTVILDFRAARTARNKCILSKSPGLWCWLRQPALRQEGCGNVCPQEC